ncbi:hypothetical protein KFE25_011695 [Diacronema lutheri]|uniref:Uncharacterized protein n=1 Tax=Diacronema lutheri TaxID=2081491 RepID=A0A8J5XB36_DIALT|nr:hypothetical protein KFE25_011695 [Diacronema lutheri]
MNWAIAESEGFRRNAMVDEEDDEEHRRYLEIKAAEAVLSTAALEPPRHASGGGRGGAQTCGAGGARLPVTAGTRSGQPIDAMLTRELVEREHARRQAAVAAAAGACARRDGYLASSGGARACASAADAWSEIGQNRAQQADEARNFLSQWGDVLR